tara:strand:+ start:490 stop:735 length:246 start_codon:yes stop_codon:yes gene_type:complete
MLLRTPDAAKYLQISESFLKRKRDTHGGFLVGGEHYFLGASSNASIRWDVDAITREFHKRGQLARMNTATTAKQLRQLVGA